MEIFGINLIKSLTIVLAVILYWKFVYFRYHKKDITPISYFIVGGTLFFLGVYYWFFNNKVSFEDIKFLHYVLPLFLIISFILVGLGIHKHGLKKDVDITLTWAKKNFKFIPFWFWMIIAFPALFFIMIGTFSLLGEEHIVFWAMILIAWVRSNIILYRKEVLR